MKKRILAIALVLATLLALFTPALADPFVVYANAKKVKVYAEPSKDSAVIKKLKGGRSMVVEDGIGDWYIVYVESDNLRGWVQVSQVSQSIPAQFCKHNWSDWTVTREATCAEKGRKERTCSICGTTEKKDIKQLKHTFGDWKVTKEGTCAKPGEHERKCKVCGYVEKEELVVPHSYDEWVVLKEATCSEEGERTRKCKVCGYVQDQAIEKLPHDFVDEIITEATDHSSGLRARVCQVCGYRTGEEDYDPEGTLRRKAQGEDVRAVQQLLIDQGYLNVGGADGIFGGGTEKAVMQFQKDQGLEPDGVVWPQTRQRLNHEFGPWQVVKPMTRTEPGERMRVCQDCGYEQHETIEAGTTLEYGARGEEVRAIQQILGALGFDPGVFDGIYGQKLDAAFTAFAEANRSTFIAKEVRPGDVDALVNAWFASIPEDQWMGDGDVNAPVNLALTVTPSSDSATDAGVTTFAWTLTNMGGGACQFTALLLTYGDAPDFRQDNLVMVIDGEELKADCGNSVSGSFSVASDWGEGKMNFAAMAVNEADNTKWLSNTITFNPETSEVE